MAARQKEPLRELTADEVKTLSICAQATSERVDRRQRAHALLAVVSGASFSEAARQAGYQTGDTVAQLVERFHRNGLAALDIGMGRGRKPTYGPAERTLIVQTAQTPADRRADGTATWSLKLLEQALRKLPTLPHLSADTVRRVLREAGASYQHTRTWCITGTAERLHKRGRAIVHDPDTEAKKS
jgi:transposase